MACNYDYNDEQLLQLVRESSDTAKDLIFEKYKYIIDVEIKKYTAAAKKLNIEYNDLYQEALVGFTDALYSYRNDKDTKLSSFITLCVDRRLNVFFIKAGRLKNMLMNNTISLDNNYKDYSLTLKEILSDNQENDPLENIVKEEKYNELIDLINNSLTTSEYQVYALMVSGLKYTEIAEVLDKSTKQIDNAMQRIRKKIKKILENSLE